MVLITPHELGSCMSTVVKWAVPTYTAVAKHESLQEKAIIAKNFAMHLLSCLAK